MSHLRNGSFQDVPQFIFQSNLGGSSTRAALPKDLLLASEAARYTFPWLRQTRPAAGAAAAPGSRDSGACSPGLRHSRTPRGL